MDPRGGADVDGEKKRGFFSLLFEEKPFSLFSKRFFSVCFAPFTPTQRDTIF